MTEHSFLIGILSVCGLLTLSTIVHPLCRYAKIPFAVGLLLAGMVLSIAVQMFSLESHLLLNFSPEIVFYIFLPTLIFESAYHLNFRQFRGVLREVTTLATLGILLSVAVTGAGLHYLLDWPWVVSLLFGALISATDPVAVLAIFKEVRAPKKLSTLIDGESLVNDGTALVLFQFLLGLAIAGTQMDFGPKMLATETLSLISSLILGLGFGVIMGAIFSMGIARAHSKGVKLTLSLILAHMTFLIAEGLLGVSGILATMAAGMIMGNFGQRKLKPSNRRSFSEIWQFMGFVSNALIFLLLGIKLGEINFLQYWFEISIAIIFAVFLSRALAVLVSFNFTNSMRPLDLRIKAPYQIVTFWGGIRGALAATAVLLVPASFPYAEVLQAMTAGVIIFTFLINSTTISWWLRKLRIVDFTGGEKLQRSEAQLVINEEICQYLDSLLDKKYISGSIHESVKDKYLGEHKIRSQELAKIQTQLSGDDRELTKILTHYALGIELKSYNQLFATEEVTEERFRVLESSIYRQIERLERDILPEERTVNYKYAPDIPKDFWMSRWLKKIGLTDLSQKFMQAYRHQRILARLQHYRARRIASWKVLSDFKRLQADHPVLAQTAPLDKIIKRYERWHQNAEKKMQALDNKFPKIVTEMRTLMAERMCLEKERKLEQSFLEKGFISEKIHADLDQDVGKKFKDCRHQTWIDHLFKN